MATQAPMPSITATVRRYFPAVAVEDSASSSDVDGTKLVQAIYPNVTYSDSEKAVISQELARSAHFAAKDEDRAKQEERLGSLNTHLSTRTTILGSKHSVADIVLYSRVAPLVKSWSQEKKTGEYGYHHIVRYVDFVQNSPIIGLSVAGEEKVAIDPSDVLFMPKALDSKAGKERKKKEEATATTDGKSLVVGQVKEQDGTKSKKEKAKEDISGAEESVEGAVAGTASTTAPRKKEKKEKQMKPQKQPAKETQLSPSLIDLRVGHIIKAVAHPNADSLFVSTIAVGDATGTTDTSEYEGQVVRTVCSGLNGLIPLEEMQNRRIVAVCNLKPVTMRGVKSCAMVLAASPRLAEGEVDNHAGPVELVSPPEGAVAGERILFDGWEGEPEGVLNPKKKVWDMCQVGFTTTYDMGVAFEKGRVEQLKGEAGQGKPDSGLLRVKGGGLCTVKSLKGAIVR